MSYEVITKTHAFTVTSVQTILADDIQYIVDTCHNKIDGIKRIRAQYSPIGIKDAKEIYEAVEDNR